MNILQAIDKIFKPWFRGESWDAWLAFLAALFQLKMDRRQAAIYRSHTGRSTLPKEPFKEAWLVVGRRGGKSLVSALCAVYLSCFKNYAPFLGPGEVATVAVIACDRRQARVIMRYISGFIDHVPMLAALVTGKTKESIELSNRVCIEVHVCSFRSVRGYTIAAAICDEIAYWRDESFANPDTAILNALRPALATIPGSMLLCISSPYARRGALWQAYQKHFAKDGDGVLVWQAPSRDMNPSLPQSVVDRALEEDEASASAEYLAQFRRDIESYINRESVEACIVDGRRELGYVGPDNGRPPYNYVAFVDPSGGSADSFTMAISHKEASGRIVLDVVRESLPPFSPEQVVTEYAALARAYHIGSVTGDKYAGEFPRELFRNAGVQYRCSEKAKSDLYRDLLPLINSEKIDLLDNARLINQLCQLERRTARGGRDSIDHQPNSHDDLANAVAGALTLAASGFQRAPGDLGIS